MTHMTHFHYLNRIYVMLNVSPNPRSQTVHGGYVAQLSMVRINLPLLRPGLRQNLEYCCTETGVLFPCITVQQGQTYLVVNKS